VGTSGKPRFGRAVVVEAAVRNFAAFGYHGTSVRDIARAADVTVASIYHHFASKQEILQDVMARTMTDLIGLTGAALAAAGPTPAEQLSALMRAWILYHTTHPADALIGASELRSLDGAGRARVVALRDEQERMFAEVVARGVATGDFGTPYPREAARAVINMGYAVASWYRPGGDASPAEMADRYCELALATVRAAVPTGAAHRSEHGGTR
jgi:AcrR family transcriptional regulator